MSVVRNVIEVFPNITSETLQLVMDDGRTVDIKVNLVKMGLDVGNHLVYIYDSSQSNVARGVDVFEPNFYTLDFNNIADPVEANETDLYTTILGYLQEAGGGGGDATAANQVTQINQLTDIDTVLDGIYARDGIIIGYLETMIGQNGRMFHSVSTLYTPLTLNGVTADNANAGTVNAALATAIDAALATLANLVIIEVTSQILTWYDGLAVHNIGTYRITYSSVN